MLGALISAGSAIIVGGLTLIGVIISNNAHDAVIEERVSELTREVREHNNFARRMPVVEQKIEELNRRLELLEKRMS